MTPTPEAIEALALEIRKSFLPNDIIDSRTNARWILSRFVRREEHERVVARCATCSACTPDATPQAKCECGHVREQHTQGCRMIGCDCPYYAPPDATPKAG